MILNTLAIALLCLKWSESTLSSRKAHQLHKRHHFTDQELKLDLHDGESLPTCDDDLAILYPAYNISVPVDHFHNISVYAPHSNAKFPLRYWFDASHYKKGGPVIVLQGGETDGSERLPFLQKGLLAQLAQATNGIGVILEHRYFGTSFPTPDLSTENLRFLTTEQALADQVFFAEHVEFPGFERQNLTAGNVAYYAYGGSYAGAFVAFLRKLYPDIYWGSIGSSAVTNAVWDYWAYYEPIRVYGPPTCVAYTQKLTEVVDNILAQDRPNLIQELKGLFGLGDMQYNDDFANVLSFGVGGWQGRNWDPAVGGKSFSKYCDAITATSLKFPSSRNFQRKGRHIIQEAGYGSQVASLSTPMLNFVGYVNQTYAAPCLKKGQTLDQCYSNRNATFFAQDDISQWTWRSWPYMYCTQWGYLQTGSGAPSKQLPLISRTLTLEYESVICKDAFGITTPPDVDAINKYGGFDISYPRLAFIDGEIDPWRATTPHASPFNSTARNRPSTTSEPFILIEGAVHHWDENGLFPNETTNVLPPAPVVAVQGAEVSFVIAWQKEWTDQRLRHDTASTELYDEI